ncbi:MAG: UDP-N-acetylmuramoyl-L-alanine--D-glutamate ligase [Candidatus Pacebacteria bacterium]|nr:UDP-N-acetylmuramoyl-L-alanine--D-glutamate ligase [Candidatus Paceibacterota bacterium]
MKKLFKDKKVLIMGLGLHGGGAGAARFFYNQGAEVLVTDLKTKKKLKDSLLKLKGLKIEYVLGRHRVDDFKNADLIIKNPDVSNNSPYLKIAKDYNIPIKTDIGVFFDLAKADIIGVTGSKGKSTAATLIYKLVKKKYPNTYLGGNIGVSVLELLSKIDRRSRVVLELSSFELEDLKQSPYIAVITNVFREHLNRYKSFKDYISAKKNIFNNQKRNDILVLNYDNKITKGFFDSTSSKSYFYSLYPPKNLNKFACYLKDEKIFFSIKKQPVLSLRDIKVYGEHNLSNILASVSVAKIMGVSCKDIRSVIRSFKGIKSRQEFIIQIKGVRYFNDTTATMPQAAVEAIKTTADRFPDSKIILIAGGQDKNLRYNDLAKEIIKRVDFLIMLPGTASDKLKKELKNRIRIFKADSMEKAVNKASKTAEKGDIVLLSPAAASFNLFNNEFDRGEQFNKFVKRLLK